MRKGWILGVFVLALALSVSPVLAQTTPSVDWAASATTLKDTLVSMLNSVWPIAIAIMGFFMIPRLVKRLLKLGTGG